MLIPTDRPAYRILNPTGFFGPDDHLYSEGDCIVFEGIPNEEMEPLNALARERLEAYSEALDDGARKVAEKNGREYTPRPRTMEGNIDLATADARRPQLIQGGPGVPIMGGKKRNAPYTQKLTDDAPPDQGNRRGPGRPRKAPGEMAIV